MVGYHVTPTRSLGRIQTHGLFPQVGDRSKKLGEAEPAVYFFLSWDAVEDALMNWLGDEFGENTRLALLKVNLDGLRVSSSAADYEIAVLEPVTPDRITVVTKNVDTYSPER